MAVKDVDAHHPTDSLILSRPRRHFRTSVSPVHWQLRSLIGTGKANVVYFPAGNANVHVQKLNTDTSETETVTILPFQPRCLVSGNGWICCGGETGEFAAIQIDQGGGLNDLDLRLNLDPDARLPLDLDPPRSDDGMFSLLSRSRPSKSLIAKSKTFGKERVNCITLWFPPTLLQPNEGAYNRPVAVLSNNDKTVCLVSLQTQEALEELDYPDCVNRAAISPDGRLLVAISDDPYLYVHERREKAPMTSSFKSVDRPAFEWNLCNKVHLASQSKNDKSDNRGSFAACFSSTGRYLAVGTQYGTISIFDANALSELEMDPLLTSFTSSRPNLEVGAIRDMAFAPGPVDLLAWTEDRGRVGVADVRSCFVSRQILQLDKQELFDHVSPVDEGNTIDPRLLDQRPSSDRHQNLASTLASTLDFSANGDQTRRSEVSSNRERYNYPLTTDETMVLEALQNQYRRQAQRSIPQRHTDGRALSNDETLVLEDLQDQHRRRAQRGVPPPHAGSRPLAAERGMRATLATEIVRSRERSATVSLAVSDILGGSRDRRGPQERLLDNQERLRDTQELLRDTHEQLRDTQELLRNSQGVLDSQERVQAAIREENDADRRRTVAQLALRNLGGAGRTTATVPTTEDDLLRARNHAAMRTTVQRNLSRDLRSALDVAQSRRRDRAAQLMREWEESPSRRHLGYYMARGAAQDPYDTAGLSWSEDGTVLFVGAEGGVYEFRVNVFGRKLLPSIAMR